MAFLYDFFPVILFFVVYKLWGIYSATAVLIVASLAQIGLTWLRKRQIQKMHVITAVLVLIFGGITLLIRDEIFIKWKPTVVNWLFAAGFLASQWIGRQPIIQRLLNAQVALPEAVWRRLNTMWAAFFLLMGAANLFVVYRYDTDAWVNFKLFGMLGLTVVFVFLQALYLARHLPEDGKP